MLSFAALKDRVGRRLSRFTGDQRGVSAVEFALLLPLMLTLYIGCVEVSQAVSVDRKVSLTARAVADLVAQGTNVNNAEMANILSAAKAVTAPYPVGPLSVTVSSVKIDANKKATVEWSDGLNASPRGVGEVVPIDERIAIPDTYLIWAEVKYVYTPIFGGAPTDLFYKLTGPKTLRDQIYMRPRLQAQVTRSAT